MRRTTAQIRADREQWMRDQQRSKLTKPHRCPPPRYRIESPRLEAMAAEWLHLVRIAGELYGPGPAPTVCSQLTYGEL